MSEPGTETVSPRYEGLDTWVTADVLQALWGSQLAAVAAVGPALPALAAAVDAAASRLKDGGGRLCYAGAGTSGRIGVQDGAELTPTFDWPADRLVLLMAGGDAAFVRSIEGAEDSTDVAGLTLTSGDVLLGIAASGATPYTLACLRAARHAGALTIGVANSAGTPLLDAAEHAILVETGAEVVAGSTRLAAGTAQKVVLNLFSTALMVRLGRTYRGQMVDMQARNAKLQRRAVRMLGALTGVGAEQAQAALDSAGGHVKTAALLLNGLDCAEAQAALRRHEGHLRATLHSLRQPDPG